MSRPIAFLNPPGWACLLAVLFATGQAYPATYHVATDGSGNFTTIAQVNAASFSPGDSVLFRRGDTWRGVPLNVPSSGAAGQPITFGAYGTGALPKILGSITKNSTGDWTSAGTNLWRSAATSSTREVCNLIFNNEASCGIRVTGASACTTQGYWSWRNDGTDGTAYCIYLYSVGNPATYYSGGIECALFYIDQGQCQISTHGNSYLTIQNLDLRYCGCHGMGNDGISGKGEHDIIIENCSVSYIGGAGPGTGELRLGVGINVLSEESNVIIRNNRVDQCFDQGITVELYYSPVTQSNIYIYNNIISNCGTSFAILAPPNDTISNCYFENNTCINSGEGWGHVQRMGTDENMSHLSLCCSGGPPILSSVYIRNNLFYGTNPSTRGIIFYGWPSGSNGLTIDYNSYSLLDGNVFYIQTDPYTFNYTSFNTKLGTSGFMNKPVNANSSTANPLLVYPTPGVSEDFHLQGGSPCIDHATVNGCNRKGISIRH